MTGALIKGMLFPAVSGHIQAVMCVVMHMSLEHLALSKTDDFQIRHDGAVHSGKVRSVYWLTNTDSEKFSNQGQVGVMITSDRISAFDCNWVGEDGLSGVPGKGAVLNAISQYWFDLLAAQGIANHHRNSGLARF